MTQTKIEKILTDKDLINFLQAQEKLEYLKNQRQKRQTNRKYQEFFSDVQIENIEKVQEMHYKLKEHGFVINQNCKNQQYDDNLKNKTLNIDNNFSIKAYNKTSNWEAVQLDCKLGIYRKRFLVLNQMGQKKHNLRLLSMGNMGQIYHYQNQNQNFAIKCINSKVNSSLFLNMGIKQYFIMNMMSVLQIGPKIKPIAGFDFICNQKCLQFSMEQCQPLNQNKLSEKSLKSLKILLKKMHLLNLIHFDIKPSNIMFSQHWKKIIFIDFGLSQFINQKVGQKTLTNFRGTFDYCGQQFKKCLLQRKPKYVDLYSNDVECLKNTFISFESQKKDNFLTSEKKLNEDIINIQAQNSIKLILIKFYLIKQEIENAQKIILSIKKKIQVIFAQIYIWLTFLPCLQIYETFGKNHSKESKHLVQYEQFLQYYNLKNPFSKKQLNNKTSNNMLLQKFYKNIQNSFSNFNIFQKNKAKQFLCSQKYYSNHQRYFLVLVQYLSFCRNIFNTNLEQKYQVAKMYLQNIKQIKSLISQKIDVFISQQIKFQQLITVIKCVSVCLQVSQNNIQNSIFRNFYLDLLQQSFFLKNKIQPSDNIFYKVIKNQTKIIKKFQIFMRCYYGFIQQILKIRISRSLFLFIKKSKKYFTQIVQPRVKQFKLYIQEIFIKDSSYSSSQKQFYTALLQTILSFIQIDYQYMWQRLQQYHLIWKFIQKYKQKIYGELFQNTLQILFHLSFYDQVKTYLVTKMPKQFYQEYVIYTKKSQNIVTKIDLQFISLYAEEKSYYKLKKALERFDQKVNCSQIGNLYFTEKKILLAFVFNQQNQIKKFSDIIFNQNHTLQIRQNIILKIRCFSKFQYSKDIFINSRQTLYMKIKNWIYPTVKFFLQKYSNSSEEKQTQQNFYKSRLLLHAFYQLVQYDQTFLKKQKLSLRKMIFNFQKIYYKIDKNEQRSDVLIIQMLQYYENIQNDIIEQINFLINLDLKSFQNLNHFSNFIFIQRLIKIKKKIQQRFPNYQMFDKQNIFFYQIFIYAWDKVALSPFQCKQLIIYYSLQNQQLKILRIFSHLNKLLKQKWNLDTYKDFIIIVKRLIHPKQCNCNFDSQYKKSYQILTNLFINNLKKRKIRYNFQSYFAVIFALYVPVVKQSLTIQQIRLILIFIARSFYYLDKFTKSKLLQNYYKFHLNLHQLNSQKYFNVYKKYFLSSKNRNISSILIKNMYFKKGTSIYKKKTISSIFQYTIQKKIQKIQNCFIQNPIISLKQKAELRLVQIKQKQENKMIKQVYNSIQKLNEVNQKIKRFFFQLKKTIQVLFKQNHYLQAVK